MPITLILTVPWGLVLTCQLRGELGKCEGLARGLTVPGPCDAKNLICGCNVITAFSSRGDAIRKEVHLGFREETSSGGEEFA